MRHLKEKYPDTHWFTKKTSPHIYVVLDNWPTVHKHPQAFETFLQTGIHPAFTPTYSPESNPIELLWGQLSDEVLRLHNLSDDWPTLKERVNEWLLELIVPSDHTINMVGLNATPAIRVNAD